MTQTKLVLVALFALLGASAPAVENYAVQDWYSCRATSQYGPSYSSEGSGLAAQQANACRSCRPEERCRLSCQMIDSQGHWVPVVGAKWYCN